MAKQWVAMTESDEAVLITAPTKQEALKKMWPAQKRFYDSFDSWVEYQEDSTHEILKVIP